MQFRKRVLAALALPVLLWAVSENARAQSADQNLPTPVLSNEINGKIAPLDLGDPRVTRRFYAFEGTPGDLLITMESRNLNGDMDIFTAVTFRPLMKTNLYASSQSPEVTKGIYLRTRQILILRVEARTPNDEEGTYRVRFGGSFAPFSGGIPVAENNEAESDSADSTRDANRLSSAGATIPKPVEETPPVTEPKPEEKSAEEREAARKAAAAKTGPARSTTRNSRTPRPARPKPAPPKTDAAKTDETKKEAGAGEEKAAQEVPTAGAHLIIESKDGSRIDRPMSTVRRVVVEGGMIVIVTKSGKIERIPMSTVVRMAIEP